MPGNEVYGDVKQWVIEAQAASVSGIQRRFRIGYSSAARIMDQLEVDGIVGPYQGSKPRDVLIKSLPKPKKKKAAAAAPRKKKEKAAPKKEEGPAKCGAKRKSGGTCSQAAGWGTNHPGSGRCKLHGGASTGPKTEAGKEKASANSIKHGGYIDRVRDEKERLIYEYMWEQTIKKHGLDEDDPFQMATLQRACITYLKMNRIDEWEMEEEWISNEWEKDPATGEKKPISSHVYDLEGNVIGSRTGRLERIRWAKIPPWESHFIKYMQILAIDRGTKARQSTVEKAVDAMGWLWGQKSEEGA